MLCKWRTIYGRGGICPHNPKHGVHTRRMLVVFVRSIIVYVMLLVIMRLMGKRQLSELQPFEFAITLIIAELACVPMSEMQVPLLYGVIPIFTLFILHLFITKVAGKSLRFNRLLNGKPKLVMTPNGMDMRLLKKLDMNVMDLLHALRSAGYFDPNDVAYAILETNGQLSVLPKAEATPLTPSSAGIESENVALSYPVIMEGVVEHTNLQLAGVSEAKLMDFLKEKGLKPAEVSLLAVTGKNAYLQPKKGSALQGEIAS